MIQGALFALILAVSAASAQVGVPRSGGLINLNCMDALVAVGRHDLAGVFSFIQEKDSAPAFADLLVRNKAAMKKFLAKLKRNRKAANGITIWDHSVVLYANAIYSSPIGVTLEKPSKKVRKTLNEMSLSPTLTLQQLRQRRIN